MIDRDAKLAELIAASERAERGAKMALDCGDLPAEFRLTAKSTGLIAEALALDPWRDSPAWKKFAAEVN